MSADTAPAHRRRRPALPVPVEDLASRLTPDVFTAAANRLLRKVDLQATRAEDVALLRDPAARHRLRCRVLAGEYRPEDLRRFSIPKPGGGERRLGVPSMADRMVQGAVHLALQPAAEAILLPHVHGFRPGRGPRSAVAHLVRQVGSRPHVELLKADVKGLFDHLDYARLHATADVLCTDPLWFDLLGRWLSAWGDPEAPLRGVPQGAPLSPLLANLYVHVWTDVPMAVEAPRRRSGDGLCGWIRYADDFVLAASLPGGADRLLTWLEDSLRVAGLALAPKKTARLMSTDPPGRALVVLGESLLVERTGGTFRLATRGRGAEPAAGSSPRSGGWLAGILRRWGWR